jgi:hypothetical protein
MHYGPIIQLAEYALCVLLYARIFPSYGRRGGCWRAGAKPTDGLLSSLY